MVPLPQISPGRLTFLSTTQIDAVLDLYRSCPDYFLLQDGELAGLADAQELFTDIPPPASADDLFVIGYWHEETLVGVASLLANHPGKGDWYLGLLLLSPSIRGRGLGGRFYSAIKPWAQAQGATRMLLCVFQEDERAASFWRNLGFEPMRTVSATRFKKKSHVRHEMAARLA